MHLSSTSLQLIFTALLQSLLLVWHLICPAKYHPPHGKNKRYPAVHFTQHDTFKYTSSFPSSKGIFTAYH